MRSSTAPRQGKGCYFPHRRVMSRAEGRAPQSGPAQRAMPDPLSVAIVEFRRDEVARQLNARIAAGESPLALLEVCRQAMTLVGERYQQGIYFLSELLLAAESFKAAAAVLEPHLAATRDIEPYGRVVLATLKGDIHELGKNIFATLLRAQGFEVHDLGVDVPPAALVRKVEEVQPQFVGFSALLTTVFQSMKQAADLMERVGLRSRLKLMVGGGVTTSSVKEYVGADFQSTDATDGVNFCLQVASGRRA